MEYKNPLKDRQVAQEKKRESNLKWWKEGGVACPTPQC